jgi:hypothetical protein
MIHSPYSFAWDGYHEPGSTLSRDQDHETTLTETHARVSAIRPLAGKALSVYPYPPVAPHSAPKLITPTFQTINCSIFIVSKIIFIRKKKIGRIAYLGLVKVPMKGRARERVLPKYHYIWFIRSDCSGQESR